MSQEEGMGMMLRSLHIYKGYGEEGFSGTIEFSNRSGEVKLKLDQRLSEKIVAVLAEEIVASGRRLAEDLIADVMGKQLTFKAEEIK